MFSGSPQTLAHTDNLWPCVQSSQHNDCLTPLATTTGKHQVTAISSHQKVTLKWSSRLYFTQPTGTVQPFGPVRGTEADLQPRDSFSLCAAHILALAFPLQI